TIDATGHTGIADVGMDRIGKVHCGGSVRQLYNLAFGGKDINLVREEVDLHVLNKLERIPRTPLHLQQSLHPLAGAAVAAVDTFVAVGLVQEVGGDTVVSHLVHLAGADLNFDGYPVHPHQHRVQRLVAVGFGDGDVILELTGNRFVEV